MERAISKERSLISTRDKLHQLIDALPDSELPAAARALEELAHRPTLAELFANAPFDDEPLTPEDAAAIAKGRAAAAAGHVIGDEELAQRLGLPALDADP